MGEEYIRIVAFSKRVNCPKVGGSVKMVDPKGWKRVMGMVDLL